MGRIKGGRKKPVPAKMTCSEVRFMTVVVEPAIKKDEKKGIEAKAAVTKEQINPASHCKRAKVWGFDAHIGRRHRGCKVKGVWERA